MVYCRSPTCARLLKHSVSGRMTSSYAGRLKLACDLAARWQQDLEQGGIHVEELEMGQDAVDTLVSAVEAFKSRFRKA